MQLVHIISQPKVSEMALCAGTPLNDAFLANDKLMRGERNVCEWVPCATYRAALVVDKGSPFEPSQSCSCSLQCFPLIRNRPHHRGSVAHAQPASPGRRQAIQGTSGVGDFAMVDP